MIVKNTFQPGDFEAQHANPVWRSKSDFIIAADISGPDRMRRWEQLWARRHSEREFEICCIPFFVYDLNLGSVVETDDEFIVARTVRDSGRFVFRIWFERDTSDTVRIDLVQRIEQMGYLHERFSERLMSIDAASLAPAQRLSSLLQAEEQMGRLKFETGRR